MTRVALVAIIILFSVSSVNFVDSLQDNFGRFLGTFTTFKQVKIPELLNQLCNQSQGPNANLRRDACYGCFYRASILPQGFSMLAAMSTCADDYLNNTSYGHCQAYLKNQTSMPTARNPTLIYCSFLECIRQVNKDSLGIDLRGPRPTFRGVTRIERQSPFIFLKIIAQRARNNVCIIRETNVTTVRSATGSIDPRAGPRAISTFLRPRFSTSLGTRLTTSSREITRISRA
ncbi:uncharacterized protein LOC105258853 isoform X2 [Camponotus floridanus]|uniref:uncharacterized protein LOC105258853 isoform X2 n=1 Tax=Camponotus floridanus TaxID=104421 RepID=UPI00059ED5A6|nr:uncharacterized protein LOC105258853 isoform X2 [Camponotus floridanus]